MTNGHDPVELGSAGIGEPADAHELAADPGDARIAAQLALLPAPWRAADRVLLRATEYFVVTIGMTFALMITLQVISRYVFSFSISFAEAASRMLLVWFFVMGAGLALRRGAHVGFELLVAAVSPRKRRAIVVVGLLLTAIFCAEMLWSAVFGMGPLSRQTEPGLDISLGYVVVGIPVGFALLLYHALLLVYVELRVHPAETPR